MKLPDLNLGVSGGMHGEQTGKMLVELEKILEKIKPDCVMVYGDTNSTLAASLAAVKMKIPLAHVEAGLRSYNRDMPEEINRVLTDHVSSWLFCPTNEAVENLKKEGIIAGVHQVGDVMYDALLHDLEVARKKSKILADLDLKRGEYALATIHRAANADEWENMDAILKAFGGLSSRVVLPLHPRTKKMMQEWNMSVLPNVVIIEPVGRFDMLALQENANCILTDSGGVQKEAYFLGVRCITLRKETEWVETVQTGWNKLVGVDVQAIQSIYADWHPSEKQRIQLFGDGHAAEKIVDILRESIYIL